VGLVADIRPTSKGKHIVDTLKARSGLRTLVGLLAALGLVAAMTMPVLASHDTDLELVAAGTGEGDECAGFDFGFKLDGMDQLTAGTYTASDADHTVWIEIELFESGGEVTDFEILDSDPAIDSIVIKQPNEGGGISHLTFCYNEDEATPTPTPTPSPTPSPTPTEGEGGGTPTPTPSPTPNEGELGGNPTATPAPLPNTAMVDGATVPAVLLSLMLIGSLGALAYVRLARQR
jgi:hypothetical protein